MPSKVSPSLDLLGLIALEVSSVLEISLSPF